MAVTIYDTTEAIRSTLEDVAGLAVSTANETLREGMNDLPAIQVYFETLEASLGSQTERKTFGAGIRSNMWRFHIDVYVKQRSNLGDDMAKVANLTDAVIDVLEAQVDTPPFGLDGLHNFRYTAERVTFTYGDTDTTYVGVRFVVSLLAG